MKTSPLFCLSAVLFCSLTRAAKLPSFLKVCSRNDPQFKECATRNGKLIINDIIHGDRKLRMPDLDPLEIAELAFDIKGLNMTLKNVKFYGNSKAQILEFNVDFKNHILSYKTLTPKSMILSDYSVDGKISVLPIKGQGKCNFTLDKPSATFTLKYDLVKKKDGQEYMSLKEQHLDYTPTRLYLNFDNLAGGNKLVGDQLNAFMNENWKDMFRDFGPVINEGFSVVYKKTFSFLETIPYDEVFPLQ